MARKVMDSFDYIIGCIDEHESFVLQGGAGSGKTETLKDTIEYTLKKTNKVLCITHTNAAINEIKRRVSGDYDVATIHSFLHTLIKNFKENIKTEFIEIKKLQKLQPIDREKLEKYDNEYKKERYDLYKKTYDSYNKMLYKRTKSSLGQVVRKTEYDKSYVTNEAAEYSQFDIELNKVIDSLNIDMEKELIAIPKYKVHYSNRKFDSVRNMGYGHDSLLTLAERLLTKYPKLQQIIQNKYDYIFIDEYQDTDPNILDSLISKFISPNNTLGLFGDSMQAIYDNGIGDVRTYIEDNKIKEIYKEDNFRSSFEVVDLINEIRQDKLEQKVELKENETDIDRVGEVKFYYTLHKFERGEVTEKEELLKTLKERILKNKTSYVKLELSNSAIAKEMEYFDLYSHYKSGSDVNDDIIEDLTKLLLDELYEIVINFEKNNHNFVIEKLKNNGWRLKNIKDKKEISNVLKTFSNKGNDMSVKSALEKAFTYNVLDQSDGYKNLMNEIEVFKKELKENEGYSEFEKWYKDNYTTYSRMKNVNGNCDSEEKFKEYESLFNRARKYEYLHSDEFKLKEAFNYLKYQSDRGKISTMHKTKGEGIENVAVILYNYRWNKYNFDKMFDQNYNTETVKSRTQKLFYVACSRAIKNLIMFKIFEDEKELEQFKNKLGSSIFERIEI